MHYERRRPEKTALYRVVQEHVETFFAHVQEASGADLPQFVKDEFDALLECGILAHGFLRLCCAECGHDKLVAFSCKGRGFCPSCGARRMAQTAANLVDHVIPHVPVRQWVLALPVPLRLLLASRPELLTPALEVVHRVLTRFLLERCGLKSGQDDSGAVTLIQRFGSAANRNIYRRCLVLDGVYPCDDAGPVFVEAPPQTDEDVQAVPHKIVRRVLKMLTRRGALVQEQDSIYVADADSESDDGRALRPLQAASCVYRIAFGPRAGQKVVKLQGGMPQEQEFERALCADMQDFSLHAAARCATDDRQGLERLCGYITRPALAYERVQCDAAGRLPLGPAPRQAQQSRAQQPGHSRLRDRWRVANAGAHHDAVEMGVGEARVNIDVRVGSGGRRFVGKRVAAGLRLGVQRDRVLRGPRQHVQADRLGEAVRVAAIVGAGLKPLERAGGGVHDQLGQSDALERGLRDQGCIHEDRHQFAHGRANDLEAIQDRGAGARAQQAGGWRGRLGKCVGDRRLDLLSAGRQRHLRAISERQGGELEGAGWDTE